MVYRALKHCRRFFSGLSEARTFPQFASHQKMYETAFWIVRFYYIINVYFVYSQLAGLRGIGLSNASPDPVWPLSWVGAVGLETASLIILYLSLAAGFVGVLFWQYRSARLLVVVAQLLVAGLHNSFGAVNHGFHEWLWLGVCFLFLPSGALSEMGRTRINRFTFLVTVSMAQGLILLFYSLSGFYKVGAALLALTAGKVGGFSPEAMALTLANRMTQTDTDALWAPIIIENYWLGWPFYLGLYYVELVSIMVFLRPELHRVWGLILVTFHVGTFLFMAIPFPTHVLINMMIFVFSPFAPEQMNWRAMLRQLPLFGLAFIPFLSARPISARDAAG